MGKTIPPHLRRDNEKIPDFLIAIGFILVVVFTKALQDPETFVYIFGFMVAIPSLVTCVWIIRKIIERNLWVIFLQKIGLYGGILGAIFLSEPLFKILCICMAILCKSIYIAPHGKHALIHRNGKHIATKTESFLVVPFLDVVKWEHLPQETPKNAFTDRHDKDKPIYDSPFEMFFRTFNKKGVEIRYTLELHTKHNLSYHQRAHYKKLLQESLQSYTREYAVDFLLNTDNRRHIEQYALATFLPQSTFGVAGIHMLHIDKIEPFLGYPLDMSLQTTTKDREGQKYQLQFALTIYFREPVNTKYETDYFTNLAHCFLQNCTNRNEIDTFFSPNWKTYAGQDLSEDMAHNKYTDGTNEILKVTIARITRHLLPADIEKVCIPPLQENTQHDLSEMQEKIDTLTDKK